MKISRRGFTLIELLIALAVFMIGIMAVYGLSLKNMRDVKSNYYRILAADLGRESLELVRGIRDSNWIQISENRDDVYWDSSLSDAALFYTIGQLDAGAGNVGISVVSCSDWQTCLNTSDAVVYYHSDSNLYNHSNIDARTTAFARIVRLTAICFEAGVESPSNDNQCSQGEKIGILATVRVQWQAYNHTRYMELTEKFYNWR